MYAIRALLILAAIAWSATPGQAQDKPFSAFFGEYEGKSISSTEQGLSKRDLSVSIKSKGKGFTLKWTTVTHKPGGKAKRKAYSIDFRPSGRENIFASAMRKNKFGASIPLDPLKGEPYVWGRLHGSTLTVHAMMVTEDGGYEMQVYDRTLTATGLDLTFSRIRDGERFKLIKGTLTKVK
ncbi:MAG: hypothetical protein QGI13_10655 [Rhodospirillales bacterium]|jgi:hypothetical protein|nr:hypothetical protein [Rhodospirillales bacterium]